MVEPSSAQAWVGIAEHDSERGARGLLGDGARELRVAWSLDALVGRTELTQVSGETGRGVDREGISRPGSVRRHEHERLGSEPFKHRSGHAERVGGRACDGGIRPADAGDHDRRVWRDDPEHVTHL